MPMELYLYNYESSDNINNIISQKPEEKQWWITGFNLDYIGITRITITNEDGVKYMIGEIIPA